MVNLTLQNEQDTDRLGAALAEVLRPGTVVALIGTLGAGKTRLVQAVASALGVPRDAVTSPTFVLVNEYRQGRMPIFHFDTYRLNDDDEFLALGPEEYFDSTGVTFIEWADRVADLLPRDRLEVTLDVTGDTTRSAAINGTGPNLEMALDQVQSQFEAANR